MIYFYALLSVFAVSVISLIGVITLALQKDLLKKITVFIVALAAGALLGDAFIHLIPEALEELHDHAAFVSLAVIGGVLLFFLLESKLHWHHSHGAEKDQKKVEPVGPMVLVADGVHNFIDGIIIGASWLASPELGIAATIAIALHEIPQEIGDFGILVHAGYSRKKALFFNFLSALTAVLGTVLVLVVGGALEGAVVWALPVAAGMFIYIALADLLPALHTHEGTRHLITEFTAIVLGVGIMYALLFLEMGAHAH